MAGYSEVKRIHFPSPAMEVPSKWAESDCEAGCQLTQGVQDDAGPIALAATWGRRSSHRKRCASQPPPIRRNTRFGARSPISRPAWLPLCKCSSARGSIEDCCVRYSVGHDCAEYLKAEGNWYKPFWFLCRFVTYDWDEDRYTAFDLQETKERSH